MPTVKIWTSGSEEPSSYAVDLKLAHACATALTNPDAVLEFPRAGGVAYVPVRQVTCLVIEWGGR